LFLITKHLLYFSSIFFSYSSFSYFHSLTKAEQSPYYEIFKRNKTEVLFLYTPIDEFVMGNLQEYDGRKLVSAETGGIDLSKDGGRSDDHTTNESKDGKEGDDNDSVSGALSDEESKEFATWLQETLSESLSDVTPSNRLVSSPAILVDHESASIMRMMKMADQEHKTGGVQTYTPLQKMEINPAHPIIKSLNQTRNEKPELAKLVAEQLHDNALVAAGIMEDPRVMLERLNTLLEEAMKGK
jgi:TNF receptor-associated protein 1